LMSLDEKHMTQVVAKSPLFTLSDTAKEPDGVVSTKESTIVNPVTATPVSDVVKKWCNLQSNQDKATYYAPDPRGDDYPPIPTWQIQSRAKAEPWDGHEIGKPVMAIPEEHQRHKQRLETTEENKPPLNALAADYTAYMLKDLAKTSTFAEVLQALKAAPISQGRMLGIIEEMEIMDNQKLDLRHRLGLEGRIKMQIPEQIFLYLGSDHHARPWDHQKYQIDLYCKDSPDHQRVGDCPFTHTVRLVLHLKHTDYTLHPCHEGTKPDWLLNKPELSGKLPCLVLNGVAVVESKEIIEYLETVFPEPTIKGAGVAEAYAVCKGIFGAFAAYCKNTVFSKNKELHEELNRQLEALETLCESTSGAFLCGNQPCEVDFILAPQLYHMKVALHEFKHDESQRVTGVASTGKEPPKWEVPEYMTNLRQYMNALFEMRSFRDTRYPESYIIAGWTAARGERPYHAPLKKGSKRPSKIAPHLMKFAFKPGR